MGHFKDLKAWQHARSLASDNFTEDSNGWLLLGYTVQGPEPPHQIHRVDSDDRPVVDQLGENAERHAVFGVVEGRHQDGAVRDVEVRVARGEALTVKGTRCGHR